MVGTIRFDEVSILKKPDRLIRCHPIRDGSPQASHERGKRRQAIRDIASRYQRKSLVGLAEQFGDRLSEILRTLARHDGCASTAERFRRERARRALRTGLHLSRSHSGQRRVQPGRASRTGSEHVRAHERRPRLRESGHPAQRQTPLRPAARSPLPDEPRQAALPAHPRNRRALQPQEPRPANTLAAMRDFLRKSK